MPSPTAPARKVSANPEEWAESQKYELDYWKNSWPFRELPIAELQEQRNRDARWLLRSLGFTTASDYAFEGFGGSVLEVGCGPIGFFELIENVTATAIDSLMRLYAQEIPYSLLGTRGNATYIDNKLEDVAETFRFVVCSNVLDHTADWMEFLEQLTRRVGPDGELLLVTDTRGNPAEGHTQVFSPDQAVRALRWLGFPNVKSTKVERGLSEHCDARLFLRVSR